MPWIDDPTIRSLRLAYNAAVAGHSACFRALSELVMRGEQPSSTAIEAEAAAKARMVEARRRLHAAMARAMGAAPAE